MTDARRTRARLVAASTFEDPLVVGLRPQLHGVVLWVAIVVNCDTKGRTEGDPHIIRMTWLADFEDFEPHIVDDLLNQMATPKMIDGVEKYLIKRYAVGKRKHIQINEESWAKHQKFKFPAQSERPQAPGIGSVIVPPTSITQDVPGESISVHKEIDKRFKNPKFNMHQLAGALANKGVKDQVHLLAILQRVYDNQDRIINVWGYITSEGLMNTARADAQDERSRLLKEAGKFGMSSMSDIMRKIADKGQ